LNTKFFGVESEFFRFFAAGVAHNDVEQNHSGFLTFNPTRRSFEWRAAMFANPTHISRSLTLCWEIPESSVSATEPAQWIVELGPQMVRAQVRILFCSSKKVSLSLEAIISRSMSSISFINLIELRISVVSDIFSDGCLAWSTGVTREKDVAISRAMGSFSLTEH
jgi:hypothetical protein